MKHFPCPMTRGLYRLIIAVKNRFEVEYAKR
jgi:hypothetical protein